MPTDETLERALRGALHDLTADIQPDPQIGDVVLERHARQRRRARAAQAPGRWPPWRRRPHS